MDTAMITLASREYDGPPTLCASKMYAQETKL